MGGVAVGEHRAPVHRPQQLEVVLALVGVGHFVTLPEDGAEEVTVLLHQVIAAAGVLGEALGVVWLIAGGDVVAGGEVGGVQEAAGEAGAVIAPQVAMVQVTAQLLADAGSLTGYGQGHDDLGRVGLAPGHRQEGALGPGQGQERQEVEEIQEHGHWSPGAEHELQLQRAQAVMLGLLLSLLTWGIDVCTIYVHTTHIHISGISFWSLMMFGVSIS